MDALSLIAATAGAVLVIALVLHVWYAIGLSRVLAAHGGEPWRAWVPLVNEAEVFRLGRIDPVRAVLLVVPFVNVYGLVLKARAAHRLGEGSGRGAGTTTLAVLLPPAWAMVLARDPKAPDAAPPAPREIVGVESVAAEAGEVDGPIAAVPGVPTAPATADPAAPVAASAGGRRAVATSAEPFAPPVLPGPREIGAGDDPDASSPAPDAVVSASRAETSVAPAPDAGMPASRAEASVVPAPDAVPPASRAGASVAPVAVDAAEDVDGRVSETTDATAERPAGRTDVADPLDESTQTARPRSRRRGDWTLGLPDGEMVSLTSRTVVLGRKPSNADDMTQYVAVVDETRTMSKEHARLDWTVTGWTLTDLDSTNGVTLVHDDGRLERLPGGGTASVPSRFRLGDASLELRPAAG